jgi:hypothetical protein
MNAIDFSEQWTIVQPYTDPVSRCAADELSFFLREMTGSEIVVSNLTNAVRIIVLSHDDSASDGFYWRAGGTRIELYGDSPKGLLNAVYDFLESAGCRWMLPGSAGERLPEGKTVALKRDSANEKPVLPGRCLVLGHGVFMKDWGEWIHWAARNKYNTVFFHVIDSPIALGAIPLDMYRRSRLDVSNLARRFGMTVEFGGHGLSALVPRKRFAVEPELFRMAEGKRTPDYNFCTSSSRALEVLRENAKRWFLTYPGADVYHLWPDDIPGGGWCSCPECRDLGPSAQALRAANAVAEVLAEVMPGAQLSFLAYHDTEGSPGTVKPRKNVCLLWAPRKRCYAHGLGTPCPVNDGAYDRGFAAAASFFAGSGAAPARVFEYYQDAVLFKSVVPPMPATIKADLAFYAASGAHTVQVLATGDRAYLTAQLNAWIFPRLAWNPGQDLGPLLDEFCSAWFGEANSALALEYYGILEKAFALALDTAPGESGPSAGKGTVGMVAEPPSDMGDPVGASAARLEEKSRAFEALPALLEAALQALDRAADREATEALVRERDEFDLVAARLQFERARIELYRAVAEGKSGSGLRPFILNARGALKDEYLWGRTHLGTWQERRNFAFLHFLFDELGLEAIDRGTSTRPVRTARMAGTVWSLFLRSEGIRKLYR